MNKEIERKFLVKGEFKSQSYHSTRIIQGYICSSIEHTVRIRIYGDRGFLTIKGKGDSQGIARYEWETEIPVTDALELLKIAEPGTIDKTRYLIKNTDGKHVWEVDEFRGGNEGLILAEIELSSPDEPEWLGKEVTGVKKYYNSELVKNEK